MGDVISSTKSSEDTVIIVAFDLLKEDIEDAESSLNKRSDEPKKLRYVKCIVFSKCWFTELELDDNYSGIIIFENLQYFY